MLKNHEREMESIIIKKYCKNKYLHDINAIRKEELMRIENLYKENKDKYYEEKMECKIKLSYINDILSTKMISRSALLVLIPLCISVIFPFEIIKNISFFAFAVIILISIFTVYSHNDDRLFIQFKLDCFEEFEDKKMKKKKIYIYIL